MSTLESELHEIMAAAGAVLADPRVAERTAMPGNAFFLPDGGVLALPRDDGDSRYPYGRDGLNFWAYASGYMHANEGLFSLFLRAAEGQEPKVAFFAGMPADGGFEPVPLLQVPLRPGGEDGRVRRYTVLTSTAAYYVTERVPLVFGLRMYVNGSKEICFSLGVKNTGKETQRFFLSSYLNPYWRNQIYESGEDRWFKETRVVPGAGPAGLPGFRIAVNEDKNRHQSVTNFGLVRRSFAAGARGRLVGHEETASRNQYVGGVRSSLGTPRALAAGTFGKPQPLCTFTETAIAGDLLHVELGADSWARLDLVLSRTAGEQETDALSRRPLDPGALDADLEALRAREATRQGALSLRVSGSADPALKADVFNPFFEHLKKQVEFCSLMKGYAQLSENSLIGVRDVFQALEGLLFWQPDAAREKMLEALGFTAPDGRCFRQYSLPASNGETGRMDLRPFIDQGAWVISCVATYLKLTGDRAFLDTECGYHEIVDEPARKVRPSPLKNSVLEHLVRITDYLLRNRDPETGCVRALYGDWNDALDGLGLSRDPAQAYGSGVSVMATLQAYQNTQEMADLLEFVDARKYAGAAKAYRRAGDELAAGLQRFAVVRDDSGQARIVHGWGDRRSYLVGGLRDPDGQARDGITSNAFWVLSGLYDRDPGMRAVILDAFRRLDSKYGLKTFEPFFPPDTPGVGRIGKLPPGTAENGATYVHATLFGVMALFRMGCPREAWQQLDKVLPFTPLHDRLSHSPFVMPNSYGFNEEKFIDGQNMNDWQTGSSNVLLKLLIRHVFGFEPDWKGFWIQPAAWSPFESFDFQAPVRGRVLKIRFRNEKRGRREFAVNGARRSGVRDDIMGVEKLWIPWESLEQNTVDVLVTD